MMPMAMRPWRASTRSHSSSGVWSATFTTARAHDVGIFHIEHPVARRQRVVDRLVGIAPQAPAHDLLAQQLGAEGADAEDVGDGVGVPAFGQHGDGDDTTHLAAEPILAGYQPIDMSAEALIKRTDLPPRWDERKVLLGFG
jgi:hypothetical protein